MFLANRFYCDKNLNIYSKVSNDTLWDKCYFVKVTYLIVAKNILKDGIKWIREKWFH